MGLHPLDGLEARPLVKASEPPVGRGLARDRPGDEVTGVGEVRPDPSHRPTISHDQHDCLRCGSPRQGSVVWCKTCIAKGQETSRQSVLRQMQVRGASLRRNWKEGEPFWWIASGCYKYDK